MTIMAAEYESGFSWEDLEGARETLARLVDALSAVEDSGEMARVFEDLLARRREIAYLLEHMLHRDRRTIR